MSDPLPTVSVHTWQASNHCLENVRADCNTSVATITINPQQRDEIKLPAMGPCALRNLIAVATSALASLEAPAPANPADLQALRAENPFLPPEYKATLATISPHEHSGPGGHQKEPPAPDHPLGGGAPVGGPVPPGADPAGGDGPHQEPPA